MLNKIKAAQLQARKNRDSAKAAALTTLIGEAEAVGKNNGNRAPTDAEIVAVIKKFIKNIDELLSVVNPETDGYKIAQAEKELFNSFLPQQMSEAEIRAAASLIYVGLAESNKKPNMGDMMKAFKAAHEGQYDGAVASKVIKEILA